MTKKEKRSELYRLYDMQEAIAKIQSHPDYGKGKEVFDNERLGECSAVLREHYDYEQKHPELELGSAQGMRRRLVHTYWKTDLELVWKAVLYLPGLKEKLDKLVKEKELLREQEIQKEQQVQDKSENLNELVLPFPEPKSQLEELANKRAIMRAEGKLEKQQGEKLSDKAPEEGGA